LKAGPRKKFSFKPVRITKKVADPCSGLTEPYLGNPFCCKFLLAWHLVQAASYHILFLIIAWSERNAQWKTTT